MRKLALILALTFATGFCAGLSLSAMSRRLTLVQETVVLIEYARELLPTGLTVTHYAVAAESPTPTPMAAVATPTPAPTPRPTPTPDVAAMRLATLMKEKAAGEAMLTRHTALLATPRMGYFLFCLRDEYLMMQGDSLIVRCRVFPRRFASQVEDRSRVYNRAVTAYQKDHPPPHLLQGHNESERVVLHEAWVHTLNNATTSEWDHVQQLLESIGASETITLTGTRTLKGLEIYTDALPTGFALYEQRWWDTALARLTPAPPHR